MILSMSVACEWDETENLALNKLRYKYIKKHAYRVFLKTKSNQFFHIQN